MARVRFLVEAKDFSLILKIQTGSGTHPASYPMGTREPFPMEADHYPPSSAEVKNGEANFQSLLYLYDIVLN
jgi:hypothetical protein